MVSFTADDFGYSHRANIKIIELARKRKVDRVSLLVNFPKTKEAVRLYKQNRLEKEIPIGLHFNMVEGQNFFPLPAFLFKLLLGKISKEKIKQELESQIKTFKNFKLSLDHLNSHQNIHLFSPVKEVFQEVAKKYQIKYVRQKSSVIKRLKKFPLKLLFFYLYYFLNKLRYRPGLRKKIDFEEKMIHPGTSFDR